MIDWTNTAQRLGYDSEAAMWTDYYVTKGLSVSQLAKRLDVSRNTIRDSLDRCGITIRGRGGPNNQKLDITDELVEEIRRDGITKVAKKLGLSYTTLYKRIYRVKGLTIAEVQAVKKEEAS